MDFVFGAVCWLGERREGLSWAESGQLVFKPENERRKEREQKRMPTKKR